jgi:glycerol-3-phosphate O-acyltransferase
MEQTSALDQAASSVRPYHQAVADVSKKVDAFFERAFSEVVIEGPQVSWDEATRHPVMAVSTHRSQTDYFGVGYFLFNVGVKNVRYAAGDNLTRLPYIGPRFRRFGAFTVERSRASRRSYLSELCNQVVGMIESGDNIIVFPEGGRSYKGNMMQLRTGMLGAHVIAQHHRPEKPHLLLPIALSYERLPELLMFDNLEKGKALRTRKDPISRLLGPLYYFGPDLYAFGRFLVAIRLGLRYGKLYIDYGEPFAVSDVVDVQAGYNPDARDEFFAHRATTERVSAEVRKRFIALYRILPMHVVSAALLRRGNEASVDEIAGDSEKIVQQLQQDGRNCRSLEGLAPRELVEEGLRQLRYGKVVKRRQSRLRVANASIARYYAATIDGA